jgi:DNA-binding MarR family transcriptional regulator
MSIETPGANLGRRGGPRIAGLLNLAAEQATTEINGEVVARHPELRLAHFQVFRFGSIDGRRVTELAAWAGMTKQSMHELIGHLERTGYVRREPDPSDSRARLVRLTERGIELERDVVAASSRLHLRWLQQLGEARFASLWSALEDLTGRADPLPETDDLRRRATGGE